MAVVLAGAPLGAAPPVDVQTLVQRSVKATEADWNKAPEFKFRERDITAEGTKTYEVMMIDGSPYNRLIARNDRPLTSAEQQKEEEKLQAEIAKRSQESPSQRASRIAKYQRERDDDHLMLREMVKGFQYRLLGEEMVNGRDTYVLEATPNPNYNPPNARAKVLTHMRGKLWIDKDEDQWVKVEAEVTAPVSMYLVAKVGPGTRFLLEQSRVGPNLWLPKHFQMQANATILGFHHNESDDETYSHYQQVGTEASAQRPAAGSHR